MNPLALIAGVPSLYLWVALAWSLSVGGAFVYGLHLGNERLESFRTVVKAVGEAQEERSKRVAAERARVNQEIVHELAKRTADLTRSNAALLASVRQHARRSVLPPARSPTDGGTYGSSLCVDRVKLDAGLQRSLGTAAEGLGAILQRGEAARLLAALCLEWDAKQRAVPQ